MTVEERLEKLERELARARRRVRRLVIAGALAVACLVGLVVGLWGRAWVVPEVQGRRFVLLDEKGKPRLWLGMGKDGSVLFVIAENDRILAAHTMGKDGYREFESESFSSRGGDLKVFKDGSAEFLTDKEGKVIWKAP